MRFTIRDRAFNNLTRNLGEINFYHGFSEDCCDVLFNRFKANMAVELAESPAKIVKQPPASLKAVVGKPLAIELTSSGGGEKYMWYKNDVIITETDMPRLAIDSFDVEHVGTYKVLVRNPYNIEGVTSNICTVSV